MGLTCSLLGHAFDETDVDRERSEQGSEVVTVVRELEVCRRCGATRVVSENKEVTSIVEPDDDGPAGFSADPHADTEPAAVEDTGATDSDEEPKPDPTAEPDETAAPAADSKRDPAEEDAEILDTDGEPERAPGEWPGSQETDEQPQESEADGGPVDLTATPETDLQPAAGGVPDGDYVCPACGFSEPIEGSSLRRGDACPECQRGYLEAE
ncbi:hypothetical protein [Halosegnis sp.]|uniref:DUF7093 family protein n=1 Tax=Halosegnis sp. TaxID=2864959 RepID=UPI0035D4384D